MYSIGTYIEDYYVTCSSSAERSLEDSSASLLAASPGPKPWPGQAQQAASSIEQVGRPFNMHFARLAKVLGFERFEDVTNVLSERFLYCAKLQDESLRKVVDF